jgi:hypothetical protein
MIRGPVKNKCHPTDKCKWAHNVDENANRCYPSNGPCKLFCVSVAGNTMCGILRGGVLRT